VGHDAPEEISTTAMVTSADKAS